MSEIRRGNHLEVGGAGKADGEVGGRGVEVVARWQRLVLQPPLISAVCMPEFVGWRGCGGDGVGSTYKGN